MKKFGLLIFVLFSTLSFAQPWNYNFGTGTGSHTSGISTTFLPTPETNGGTAARVRIGTGGGSFNLEDQTISFGSQSYLRGVAPTGTSVNKFSIYDYTPGKSFTIQFNVRFGASDGSNTGAASGTWYFFAGDGTGFSDNNGFTGAQVFTGIKWQFGASGEITTNVRVSGSWTATGITGTPFSQGNTYTVDIYGNNTTTTANYTYGTSQSVAANTMDIWVNGILVANDIGKALLADDFNIDSYMFYGENSTDNVANIFLDDIIYTNKIASVPLPVELSSFSASVVGNSVKLNWRTETEVNNYGFEVERKTSPISPPSEGGENEVRGGWTKIGFVNGNGNSNSPKSYSFTDTDVLSGKYYYRLKQIDNDGQYEYSKTVEVNLGAPKNYGLDQNYPNPFNPATTITYNLPQASNVKLTVYNLLGQEVKVLVDEFKEAGSHIVNFDAENLYSGLYIYKLQAGSFTQTRKMTLIK